MHTRTTAASSAVLLGLLTLVLTGLAFSAGPARATGSGTISCSPNHLALSGGQLGTSTITWSTTGMSYAEVWVSADGGGETLFAGGASGSAAAPWIQSPGYYVFALYEGSAHANRLAYTSVTTQYPPASSFGFNYWPAGWSNSCLNAANWPSVRPKVEADMNQMASLGAGVLRIMIWPESDSWSIAENGGGLFNAGYAEQVSNLPDLVRLAYERNLQVIICFGNSYLTWGPSGGQRWWQWAYGSDWTGFVNDSVRWASGYVTAIQASPFRSTVIFYDYQNEVYSGTLHGWAYVNALYDRVPVPMGMRGISVANVPSDVTALKSNLAGRRLDYVDFHSYPAVGFNPEVESCYDTVRSAFPDSTVLLGEFGVSTPSPSGESLQQTICLDLIDRAITRDIPYFLHWSLWDNTPPAPDQVYGCGYDPDTAKHVLGGASARLNLVSNPDMETVADGIPTGWGAGGRQRRPQRVGRYRFVMRDRTLPVSFSAMGPSATDAGTNQYYARAAVTGRTSGMVWVVSPATAVRGGRILYLDAYVRSNLANIRLSVDEYDADGVQVAHSTSGSFTPVGWSWNNILHKVPAWAPTLRANTRHVVVGVVGDVRGSPSYLDVDTFSAHQRRG